MLQYTRCMPAKQQLTVEGRTLSLTNLDKALYPEGPFTKAQAIDYYARAAPWLLPHLRGRPITLNRFPDGVKGHAFYEKDAPKYTPDWIHIAPVPRRNGGPDIRYIVINDLPTLIWCANMASLELHPFLHREQALDTPTSIVFDLDPGPGTTVVDCAEVAFLLRGALTGMKLQCFPKVSGSKGIQLYVPLNTAVTYAATQPFAKSLAELMEREHPDRVVSQMAKDLRAGKVFIDWSQNSDFKTTVGVYSLRAKREKPFVSLPVTWEELDELRNSRRLERLCLEPAAALARMEKVGDLFEPVLTLKQKLPAAPTLEKYNRKRDFSKTKEPPPAPPEAKDGRRFVIQKHAASHLHYDFRLEMDGVLKSWAVPKGVPYELKQRRLAMATEDHPVAYLDFEGTIPKGQYGGGTVMVWDIGTYELMDGAYGKGKLHFRLHGKKLNGEWVLAGGRDAEHKTWFLMKAGEATEPLSAQREDASALTGRTMEQIGRANDAQWHSNRTEIPGLDLDALPQARFEFVEPMQAKPAADLPNGDNWRYEIKLDGYRALAIKNKGAAQLFSRRSNPLGSRFPEITGAVAALEDGLILDGEIVALDEQGRPSFHLIQNRGSKKAPLVFYAFDILAYRGRDLRQLPLTQRRAVLENLMSGAREPLRLSVTLEAEPADLIAAAREQALEGVIAKRADSLYEAGERTGAWIKVKLNQGQELVIGGYKPGKDGFENLAVGYYEGDRLQFIGKVKNGFVPATKREVAAQFDALETGACPFANLPEPKSARRGEALTAEAMKKYRWLEPKLVAQVEFTDWTAANHLRHSKFVALRDDKDPRGVVHEQ